MSDDKKIIPSGDTGISTDTDTPLKPTDTFSLKGGKLVATGVPKVASSFRDRVRSNMGKQGEETYDEFASTVPNRICLMLDCSGSMYGQSIKDLHTACDEFIRACNFGDTALAIHTFGKEPELNGPLSRNAVVLQTLTSQLPAEGGTPMRACMEKAIELIPMTRGLIVSDGSATDWSKYDDEYKPGAISPYHNTVIQSYISSMTPVDCVHIGTGTGAALLKYIAEVTGGMFIKFSATGNFAKAFKYLAPANRALLGDGSILRSLGGETK